MILDRRLPTAVTPGQGHRGFENGARTVTVAKWPTAPIVVEYIWA
jgi:hypothetical protein